MELTTTGRVLVTARIENVEDLYDVMRGRLAPDQVRFVQVDDALVDTGASTLSLPRQVIEHLGLIYFRSRMARTASGTSEARIYGLARLTIQGR